VIELPRRKLKLKIKKGALHRQLGIPEDRKIPVNVLNKILSKDVGEKIKVNGKTITVTSLLKKRANFAKNARKWRKR